MSLILVLILCVIFSSACYLLFVWVENRLFRDRGGEQSFSDIASSLAKLIQSNNQTEHIREINNSLKWLNHRLTELENKVAYLESEKMTEIHFETVSTAPVWLARRMFNAGSRR